MDIPSTHDIAVSMFALHQHATDEPPPPPSAWVWVVQPFGGHARWVDIITAAVRGRAEALRHTTTLPAPARFNTLKALKRIHNAAVNMHRAQPCVFTIYAADWSYLLDSLREHPDGEKVARYWSLRVEPAAFFSPLTPPSIIDHDRDVVQSYREMVRQLEQGDHFARPKWEALHRV